METLLGRTRAYDSRAVNVKNSFLVAPSGICLDEESGEIYIADSKRQLIFKVFGNGTLVYFGGLGTSGFNGDGYVPLQTQFNSPSSLSIASNGDLFIADSGNNRIRIISSSTGLVSSIVSNFNNPLGVFVSKNNMLYIADTGNDLIIRYNILNKEFTTICGGGELGVNEATDGVSATLLKLNSPKNIFVISNGNQDTVYFTDNNRIRSIDYLGKFRVVDGSQPQSNL